MSQALPSCEGGVHISQPANTVQAKEGPAARRTLLTVPVGHPVATHTALRSCVLFQGRPCGASPAASGETRPSSALCSACPTSMPMGPRTCWSSSRRRTRYCPIPAVRPPHRASSGLPRLAGRALPTRAARAALRTAQAPRVPQPCQPRPRRPAGGLSPVSSTHAAQVNGYIYSGGTGQQVSPPDSLGVDGTSGSILHVTRAGAHYVLVPCGTWHPQPQDCLLHGPAGTRVEAGVGLAVPPGMRGSHPLRGDQAFLCSQALPSAAAP